MSPTQHRKDAPFVVFTAKAPSGWASGLLNNDWSGSLASEHAEATAWISRLGYGSPVSCGDAGFVFHHDAWDEFPLAADCQTFYFLVPREQLR